MGKQVLKSINNAKLTYKLVMIYLLTGLLPIMILFSFSYFQMKQILLESDNQNVQNFVQQSVSSVDGQLEIYNNLSNYISFNDTISRIVSYDYKSEYEMYTQFVHTFDPMVSSLKYFHDDVNRVTIYTNGDMKHDTTIAPISEILNEPWYEAASADTRIQWFADSMARSLISARKMPILSHENILGIMYINVDYNKVFSAFEDNLNNNYGIIIMDSKENLVYSYDCFDEDYADLTFSTEEFQEFLEHGSWNDDVLTGAGNYSVIRNISDTTGWTTYMYEPKSLVVSSAKPIVLMIFVAAAVAILGASISILFTSRFITGRIKKLQANMHEVEHGNFQVQVVSEDQDEIGELIQGFGNMLDKINNLISEVYEGKISQKEYEMRALRAQINPHFLYNSLSLINWKAIEYGQDDISAITLALSNYYRTSLNKGKNTLSIEMELMNMKSYLDIQLVMHDNAFDVEVNVDKEIYEYETLNLILQPIVENAIDHGIDLKTEGRGLIRVTGHLENGTLLTTKESENRTELNAGAGLGVETYLGLSKESSAKTYSDLSAQQLICLMVEDNGVGMDAATIEEMLCVQSKGYGARNVNERIKLYYGEQYNLKVESVLGEGTRVIIRFPARKHQG